MVMKRGCINAVSDTNPIITGMLGIGTYLATYSHQSDIRKLYHASRILTLDLRVDLDRNNNVT